VNAPRAYLDLDADVLPHFPNRAARLLPHRYSAPQNCACMPLARRALPRRSYQFLSGPV